MKIAIPVNEKKMESTICMSFGRTPYFMLYETDNGTYEFVDNAAVASQGGAGVKAAQSIVDQKIEALLAPRCGENASVVLSGAGVKIYKTEGISIIDNIGKFKESQLPILVEIHEGFHHHGQA